MPEEEKQEDPTPATPTPEEVAELRQTKADFEAHKAALETFELKDGEKTVTVNLLTDEGKKQAQQFGSGGFHVAQEMEKLNQKKAALDADVAERVKVELEKRGQSKDAAGEAVDVKKLIADNKAFLAKALEESDVDALTEGLEVIIEKATKPRKSEPAEAVGVTKEELAASTHASEARVIFNTKVRTDPRYIALTKKLAEVNDCTEPEAEMLIAAKKGDLDASDPVAVSGWMRRSVAGPRGSVSR